jgi:hypothetical protein
MAKKSSLIDAVLNAGGLSEVFTQDVEDMKPENFGDGGADPYQSGEDRIDGAMPAHSGKPLSTHCPIGQEWRNVPWGEVDEGFLRWILDKIDDKPDLVDRARQELGSRSVETDESKDRRLDGKVGNGSKKRLADFDRPAHDHPRGAPRGVRAITPDLPRDTRERTRTRFINRRVRRQEDNVELSTQRSLAVAELTPIVTDIAAFAGTIEGIDVADEETQGQVGDLVKMMQHRRRKIEDKRESLVKPLNTVVREINALFKPPRDRIDEIVQLAKSKMNHFAQAQVAIADEKRRQEREQAAEERREAQELADALRKKAHQEAVVVADVVVEEAEKKVEKAAAPAKVAVTRGQESSVSVTKTWKAEVVDILELAKAVAEGRVPTHLIQPNMRALQDLARELKDPGTVNGVRIYLDVGTTVR